MEDLPFIEIMRESSTQYNTVPQAYLQPGPLQHILDTLIGTRGDPGTDTNNVKEYLLNLKIKGLPHDIVVRIESILDFLPMVMYLPFGCLHDFSDKKVARVCLKAGLQVWKNARDRRCRPLPSERQRHARGGAGAQKRLAVQEEKRRKECLQDIIHVLRDSGVSLPVLGLDITEGGDVLVRGNADTGEETFSTKDTKKLHTEWENLFDYIFSVYIPSVLPEGIRWNFIPIRESFSMLKTEPKNDDTKRALAKKIIQWVNSFDTTGLDPASRIYAALDVTDTVGLMVCQGRVLEAAENL